MNRLIRLLAPVLLLGLPQVAAGQTLREVLHEFALPFGRGAPPDLDRPIGSYSAENWSDLFVIAFYLRETGREQLSDTLRVSAYDRAAGTWTHASLDRSRLLEPEAGSVLGIQHSAGQIFLDTHINPSAGTIIVLSRSLQPLASLDGWLLKLLPSGRAFYHRSMPHFVATHAAELWVWDSQSGRDVRVYPGEPYDSVRLRYIEDTRRIYQTVGEDWFRAHNHPMDAEHFGSSIRSRIRTDPSGEAVVFLMQFGEDEDSPARTPFLDVVVTCRGAGTERVLCTEIPLAVLQDRHPGWSATRILDELIAGLPATTPQGAP